MLSASPHFQRKRGVFALQVDRINPFLLRAGADNKANQRLTAKSRLTERNVTYRPIAVHWFP